MTILINILKGGLLTLVLASVSACIVMMMPTNTFTYPSHSNALEQRLEALESTIREQDVQIREIRTSLMMGGGK